MYFFYFMGDSTENSIRIVQKRQYGKHLQGMNICENTIH